MRFTRIETDRNLRVVEGRDAILALHPLLVDLCIRCEQPGTLDYLDYFLTAPYFGAKLPHLFLLTHGPAPALAALTAAQVRGAVLLYEYRLLGTRSSVLITDDDAGERTVIAPPGQHASIAAELASLLMHSGARTLLIPVPFQSAEVQAPFRSTLLQSADPIRYALPARSVDRFLPLLASLAETLATFGPHTRRNLRAYRRRAESALGASFVPQVEMSREEFLALNRICAYPVPDSVAAWRFDTTLAIRGSLFAGLRSGDGAWLSLIGGRNHHRTTEIAWQMNRVGYPAYSLSTVMRSCLLEYEIARGTRRLAFDGGTPHSMRLAFVRGTVTDLLVMRDSATTHLLEKLAPRLLPENNVLRRVLARADLQFEPRTRERAETEVSTDPVQR